MIALVCEMCGAPMKTRRECEHCQTVYYTGPDVPQFPQQPWNLSGFNSASTIPVMMYNDFQTSGYPTPYGGWQP